MNYNMILKNIIMNIMIYKNNMKFLVTLYKTLINANNYFVHVIKIAMTMMNT